MYKKKKYEVVRQPFPKDLINFIYNYFLLQRDAATHLLQANKINKLNPLVGGFDDSQVPGCYFKYADWVMDTLLQYTRPLMEQKTGLKLVPTFSFARIYTTGNVLSRHSDRPSCEVSTTINLGGDIWPIYIDPTGTKAVTKTWVDEKGEQSNVKPNAPTGVRVDLNQGDMMIYAGCDLEHWREKFKGKLCAQVFLHYNNVNGPFGTTNLRDTRPILGIPQYSPDRDPAQYYK